ncbi:hypothetical protein SBOR_0071 [Sclerotinia borealis F-4128]|uniref:Uncharacterized protein n=1 Tax=Sclerotinia borealis (strain F-4128) TaxID=1432307 RepID=W9CUD4_SCLBF|nr:hypothetical protein SBOR_0071 [Sclerotinia borealis F-4128]
MSIPPAQNWYPSPNDNQPNPNSPFHDVPPQALIVPPTPLEQKYNDTCTKLKYIEATKEQIINRKEELEIELEVARIRLDEKGAEGRDGRERMRKVVVLEKLVVVYENYVEYLEECERLLEGKEEELEELIREGKGMGGDARGVNGRSWWVRAAAEFRERAEEDFGVNMEFERGND